MNIIVHPHCQDIVHRRRLGLVNPDRYAGASGPSLPALGRDRWSGYGQADMTWRKTMPLSDLIAQATQKRDEAFGRNISNSRKVFSKYHPC
jgi:hypothetical protein